MLTPNGENRSSRIGIRKRRNIIRCPPSCSPTAKEIRSRYSALSRQTRKAKTRKNKGEKRTDSMSRGFIMEISRGSDRHPVPG